MYSTHEIGHYKNVAEFGRLVAAIATISNYQPSRPELAYGNLQTLCNSAAELMDSMRETEVAYTNALKLRSKAFDEMQPLATRIYNALIAANDKSASLTAA